MRNTGLCEQNAVSIVPTQGFPKQCDWGTQGGVELKRGGGLILVMVGILLPRAGRPGTS